LTPQQLAERAASLALDKKAHDVVLLDLRKLTTAVDWFVILSADSETQVLAIADHIVESLGREGVRAWHVEGQESRRWVLVDFVDVVVHVFHERTREFYSLESLWGDARMTRFAEGASRAG
jgi:ribosome-associated protein